MSPARARFITVCQQLLALGVVVVGLVPATRVVSLDVVGVQPEQSVTPQVDVEVRDSAREAVGHPLRVRDRTQARHRDRP